MPKAPKKIGGWTNRDVDLGGMTFPRLTKRPHMGPFNVVSPVPLTQYPEDEPYRLHDLAYGKMIKEGKSPYFGFNQADQDLLNAPSKGWPDYVAKGVFYAKKFLDPIGVVKQTNVKSVYSKPANTYDASKVPFREFSFPYRSDAGNWRVNETSRRARRRTKYGENESQAAVYVGSSLYPGKRPPGYHPGLGPGGTRARASKAKGMLSTRIVYN